MCEERKENGLQDLRTRIEYLETSFGSRRGMGVAQAGEKYYSDVSVISSAKAMTWKADGPAQIHPLLKALLGLPPGSPLDSAQSKSWGVVPEPVIQNVFWSDGGVEEYFRLQNQQITITKFEDPTTGRPAAVANYTATVVASGRAKPDFGAANAMIFNLNLQNAQGGFLYEIRSPFAIGCHDNRFFGVGGRFYPDLYDLTERLHFFFSGDIRLVRC